MQAPSPSKEGVPLGKMAAAPAKRPACKRQRKPPAKKAQAASEPVELVPSPPMVTKLEDEPLSISSPSSRSSASTRCYLDDDEADERGRLLTAHKGAEPDEAEEELLVDVDDSDQELRAISLKSDRARAPSPPVSKSRPLSFAIDKLLD